MNSVPEQLARLADLLERGLLTRAEFDSQKRALLTPATGAGRTIGSYVLGEEIARGGMGAVFRARHRSDSFARRQGGEVAIKLIHPELARDAELRARFEREAALALDLQHPAIVKVFELIVSGDTLALVMELVEGASLQQLLKAKRTLSWGQAWPLLRQLLDAMAHVHAHGVVHRDLKPDNVLLQLGGEHQRIKLIDLGIARGAGTRLTGAQAAMGTPLYMAPEQHRGAGDAGAPADVYALALILIRALCGRLPWAGDLTMAELFAAKVEFAGLPKLPPDVPPGLGAALERALSPEAAARPQDAAALIQLLDPLAETAGSINPYDTTQSVSASFVAAQKAKIDDDGTELHSPAPTAATLAHGLTMPDGATEVFDPDAPAPKATPQKAGGRKGPAASDHTVRVPEPDAQQRAPDALSQRRSARSTSGPAASGPAASGPARSGGRGLRMLALAGGAALLLGGGAFFLRGVLEGGPTEVVASPSPTHSFGTPTPPPYTGRLPGHAFPASGENSELIVAVGAHFPPMFTNRGSQGRRGFDIDLAFLLAEELGKTGIRWIEAANPRSQVRQNNADLALAAISITDARREETDFSDPYLEPTFRVVRRADLRRPLGPQLGGLRCASGNGMYARLLQQTRCDLTVQGLRSADALDALLANAADVTILDSVRRAQLPEQVVMTDRVLARDEYGVAMRRGNRLLVRAVNEALAALEADGRLPELRRRWQVEE